MIYTVSCIILLVLVVGLCYLVWINFQKSIKAEQYCEAYVQLLGTLYLKMRHTKDRLKEVDRLGAFRSDDEVGFVFTEIDSAVNELYNFISKYVNTPEKQAGNDQQEASIKEGA